MSYYAYSTLDMGLYALDALKYFVSKDYTMIARKQDQFC